MLVNPIQVQSRLLHFEMQSDSTDELNLFANEQFTISPDSFKSTGILINDENLVQRDESIIAAKKFQKGFELV